MRWIFVLENGTCVSDVLHGLCSNNLCCFLVHILHVCGLIAVPSCEALCHKTAAAVSANSE